MEIDFIGWGGEDDDLYHRLRQNGLLLKPPEQDVAPIPRRPPKGSGVFRTVSQKAEHHQQKKMHNQYWKTLELLKEMHENSERWKFDGMNDAYYTITDSKTTTPGLGIAKYHHIKAIPQKSPNGVLQYHKNVEGIPEGTPLAPLEFVHVPFTGGQAITKAAARANIVWGACHYGQFSEWNCPAQGSADFQYNPTQFMATYYQSQRPWHIPLVRFSENPLEGTKRFTVVRHPYSRAISFYRYTYDLQHGYLHGYKYHDRVNNKDHPPLEVAQYLREREHPEKLNAFLQDFMIRAHHPHRPDAVELIPQTMFVFAKGMKFVHHVLHYEFLQRDFKNLLEKYEMTDVIDLPPPERKRKRKKSVVKTYDEKQIPKVTWTWRSLIQPGLGIFGIANNEPPVVDMSLAEIEDEYLLGAQDLANETIAMLNCHFEMDFKKFHYAKINVNATYYQYWGPMQVIPHNSAVAKQQASRNDALTKSKGLAGGGPPPPPPPAATEEPKLRSQRLEQQSAVDPELQAERMQKLSETIARNRAMPPGMPLLEEGNDGEVGGLLGGAGTRSINARLRLNEGRRHRKANNGDGDMDGQVGLNVDGDHQVPPAEDSQKGGPEDNLASQNMRQRALDSRRKTFAREWLSKHNDAQILKRHGK